MSRIFVAAAFAALALIVIVSPALADKIDGTWCSPAGKTMTIMGRRITTPGGNRLIGNYTRHTFNYDIPADEPGAGGRVWAEQLNEQTIAVTNYAGEEREAGPRELWSRCEAVS